MEITPKLNQDLQRLEQELNKLKNSPNVDQTLVRSVLAAFDSLSEDLKAGKASSEDLKRGVRVEKVDQDSL